MLQLGTDDIRRSAAAMDSPPEVQLRMAMRLFLQISWRHPALGRIVALEGMAGGERLEWLDAHLIGPRNRRLAELAKAAIDSGALKPFPAEMLIITLQSAAAGVINLAPMMKTSFDVDVSQAPARVTAETCAWRLAART